MVDPALGAPGDGDPLLTSVADSWRSPDYRLWQRDRVVVRGHAITCATKPGVFAHAHDDPAAIMLAEAVHDALVQSPDLDVVVMPAVTGLAGAVAVARGARHVWLTDRSALHVEATRRTLSELPSADAGSGLRAEVRMGHGTAPLPPDVSADLVVIRVVPDRLPMLQLLHDARRILRKGGRCIIAGGNHEGAKSAAKMLERLFGNAQTIAQHSSHRMASATRLERLPDVPADLVSRWLDPETYHEVPVSLNGTEFTLFTRPGVFSWEHLDEATEVLAGLMEIAPDDRVLDIGCGAGALGVVAARRTRGAVCLVDVDSDAVRCAERTLREAGCANARALVSDVASAVLDERFDVVVANPPFHVGKHTDLDVPNQFIRDAFEVLDEGGRLLLVANRTLPYEGMVRAAFGACRHGVRWPALQGAFGDERSTRSSGVRTRQVPDASSPSVSGPTPMRSRRST